VRCQPKRLGSRLFDGASLHARSRREPRHTPAPTLTELLLLGHRAYPQVCFFSLQTHLTFFTCTGTVGCHSLRAVSLAMNCRVTTDGASPLVERTCRAQSLFGAPVAAPRLGRGLSRLLSIKSAEKIKRVCSHGWPVSKRVEPLGARCDSLRTFKDII
jgi:hypothetical protein